jgi:Ser/Thr protein kinase RdoA (MazF antagonist)
MPGLISETFHASLYRRYNLVVKSATPVGTGAMNQTMKLVANQGVFFLKIYQSRQTLDSGPDIEQIAFSHAVQQFVGRHGFPVPGLLLNRDGATYSVWDNCVYALSEFVEGRDYQPGNSGQLRAAGELLGRVHQRLQDFQPSTHLAWPPMETEVFRQLKRRLFRIQSVACNDQSLLSCSQIEKWLDEVEALGQALPPTDNESWIIHGDYRAQNLKFDGDRICAILDFDAARPTNRLHDLSYALVFFPAVYQDAPPTTDQQSMFFQAYTRISPLTETERERLPVYLRLAFLRGLTLWLELAYFAGMRARLHPWIQAYLREKDRIIPTAPGQTL